MQRLVTVLGVAMAIALISQKLTAAPLIPVDVKITPGLVKVFISDNSHINTMKSPTLTIYNEYGEVLSKTSVNAPGTKHMRVEFRTQGVLTIELDNYITSYKVPYGMGSGAR